MNVSVFIQKYFFIWTFLLFTVFNKGVVYLLGKMNFSFKWDSLFSINFLIYIIITIVEFVFIAYTLLFCIEKEESFRVIRYLGFSFFVIILLVSGVGILSHYNLLN
ncbi:Uncharacterised protein [Turicibacter sanguinis]|nr:Uncharacterised protein [Turicibacter sanguinis]